MKKNKKHCEPIPESFNSIEEAGEFWDTHSLADYWDQTREVEIEVALKRSKHTVTIKGESLAKCASVRVPRDWRRKL